MCFKTLIHLLIIVIGMVVLFTGCQDEGSNPYNEANKQKTLSSLEKINAFPFYSLIYYNDYHFDDFLRSGDMPQFNLNINKNSSNYYSLCTCIYAAGSNTCLYGRNQDSEGRVTVALLVFTNPPDGYASVSMVWTPALQLDKNHLPDSSDYQDNLFIAPYFPVDGMNENGVAIADMSVPSANPPYDSHKTTLYSPNIMRLVLDYATSVDHAVSLISQYNIDFFTGAGENPVHYLIGDDSGNSAIIEFIDSEVKVIRDNNPWQVATNFIINGINIPDQVTCPRYKKAYQTLQECHGELDQQSAMDLLDNVSIYGTTWSCVYDLTNKSVSVAINRNYKNIYSFSL